VGLWNRAPDGYVRGTEHSYYSIVVGHILIVTSSLRIGFNQFLEGLQRLGTGSMELHAMYLKSIGALCARTLSYESCEFELVDGVADDKVTPLYNQAVAIWTDLLAQLADRCRILQAQDRMDKKISRWMEQMGDGCELSEAMQEHLDLHCDSDSDSDDDVDDVKLQKEKEIRQGYRARQARFLQGALLKSIIMRFLNSIL
jgi:hypothetical protein